MGRRWALLVILTGETQVMTPLEIYKRKKPVWRDGWVVGWQNSVGYSNGSEKEV